MHLPESIKGHLPLILGGVVGLYLVSRFMGTNAAPAPSANAGDSGATAAYYQGQAAITVANTQASAASNAMALQAKNLQNQYDLATATLNANVSSANNTAQINNQLAQGQIAGQLGVASSNIIQALSNPSIAAINGAYVNNQMALQTGAAVAISGNQSVTSMINSLSGATASVGNSLAAGIVGISNAVGGSSSAQSSAAAQVAAANARANSQSSGSMWSTIGTIATIALA